MEKTERKGGRGIRAGRYKRKERQKGIVALGKERRTRAGRRREGGMTFRGRRREEKGGVCALGSVCVWGGGKRGKRRKKAGSKRRPLSLSTLPTQRDNHNKSSRAITNGHSVSTRTRRRLESASRKKSDTSGG